jgi:hypothetical protein
LKRAPPEVATVTGILIANKGTATSASPKPIVERMSVARKITRKIYSERVLNIAGFGFHTRLYSDMILKDEFSQAETFVSDMKREMLFTTSKYKTVIASV